MKKFLLVFVVLFLFAMFARCAIITNLSQKKIYRSRFVTLTIKAPEIIETPRMMCQSGTSTNPHLTQTLSHMEFDVLPSPQTMKADCVVLWDVPNVAKKTVYVMFSLINNASQTILQYAYQNRPPETIYDYLDRYARTGRLCDVYQQPTDTYEQGENGSLYHFTARLRTVLTQLKLNEWLESYYLDINQELVE